MKLLFLVKREEWRLFAYMFLIVCLINLNFNILRSMRNALVVADAGGSSAFIPYFELFGTFPASILLTWGLSRLMRFFTLQATFSMATLFFLCFFLAFAFWIYPYRIEIQNLLEVQLPFLSQHHSLVSHWPDMLFYIMAELWKVALLSVLFWGLINQHLSLEEAKRFYPPLMLGSSIGTILAGPITVFFSSQLSWTLLPLSAERWQHSLYLLTSFLFLCGLITLVSFRSLFRQLQEKVPPLPSLQSNKKTFSRRLLSLSSSLRYLLHSPYLGALLLIVVAEYVSYTLGELIFLEALKKMYPTPSEYCQYMGNLTFWTGILTAFSALILAPYLLQKYRWSHAALTTPVLMVLLTLAFFSSIYCTQIGLLSGGSALQFAIVLGSLHFCIGRSMKYTLFDATKELAFVPLDQEAQVKGKLIIDGIGSRLGRGTSSLLSIALFTLVGGPGESALFAGILAVSFALISIPLAHSIGREFERITLVSEEAK